MKIIKPGHTYLLKNFENKETQAIQFIQKAPIKGTIDLEVVQEGTTNEEVLVMLIDRMKFLQGVMTSRENTHVISLLEKALMWLNKRTDDRKKRKVEGTHKA